MDSQKAKQLFETIKNDDLKTFDSLISSGSDLNICFGRFPLLSVCYLFESYQILNKYESYLINKNNYLVETEFFEIYLKFKSKAKKSLRLFKNNETVYPILMLAVIDERKKIAKYYSEFYKNDEIIEKLSKIYKLTNRETIEANSNGFIAPRKKTSIKQNFALSFTALILCLVMIFPIFSMIVVAKAMGLGTKKNPYKVKDETMFAEALSKNLRYILLENDIYLEDNFCLDKFSGTLNGNNNTIYFSEKQNSAFVKNLSGIIENLNFHISAKEIEVSNNLSFIAENLSGMIDTCKISGDFDVKINAEDMVAFSLFVNTNQGIIFNSTLDVSVHGTNITNHDAFLSGFAYTNEGEIDNCKTTASTFETNTIDTTGFVINNSGKIMDSVNNIKITQISGEQWHPNTAGFAIENTGSIENVKNNGEISSISTNETFPENSPNADFMLYASGIVVTNIGKIKNSENNAIIIGNSKIANNYVSGISNVNYYSKVDIEGGFYNITGKGEISNCRNNNEIRSISKNDNLENVIVYSGGITASNWSKIENCNNFGNIIVDSNSTQVYAGGIAGGSFYTLNYSMSLEISITNSNSRGDININASNNYLAVGGVVGFGENVYIKDSGSIGKITMNSNYAYIGGVVGLIRSNAQYGGASIFNSYSGVTFIDNSNLEKPDEEKDKETENGSGDDSQITEPITKFISNIAGLMISNTNSLNFYSNQCVKSEYKAMQYRFSYSNVINEVDIDGSHTTVFETLQELLESLVSKEAE